MDLKEVTSTLGEIFHEIAPEIEFSDLDMSRSLREQVDIDSFDFYRIIVLIHQRTGVNIPDARIAEFKNLDQLMSYILEESKHLSLASRPSDMA